MESVHSFVIKSWLLSVHLSFFFFFQGTTLLACPNHTTSRQRERERENHVRALLFLHSGHVSNKGKEILDIKRAEIRRESFQWLHENLNRWVKQCKRVTTKKEDFRDVRGERGENQSRIRSRIEEVNRTLSPFFSRLTFGKGLTSLSSRDQFFVAIYHSLPVPLAIPFQRIWVTGKVRQ